MPPPSRVTDTATGHGSFPPSKVIEGSPDTFHNSLSAHRLGDAIAAHSSFSPSPPHPRKSSVGSPNTFVNGKAQVRIGDSVACGGMLASGSGDIFIN